MRWASAVADPVTGDTRWAPLVVHHDVVVLRSGMSVLKVARNTEGAHRLRAGLSNTLVLLDTVPHLLPPLIDSPLIVASADGYESGPNDTTVIATLWPWVPGRAADNPHDVRTALQSIADTIRAFTRLPGATPRPDETEATRAPLLAHGDLHFGNILLSETGVWVIDLEHVSHKDAGWDAATLHASTRMLSEHRCLREDNSSFSHWATSLALLSEPSQWHNLLYEHQIGREDDASFRALATRHERALAQALAHGHQGRRCHPGHLASTGWLTHRGAQPQP